MQQRRLRLGDILDDYCPRERRITNHTVVAMVEDEIKQTRCTACEADHEYKNARVPPPRRKRTEAPAPERPEALVPRLAEDDDTVQDEAGQEGGEPPEQPTPDVASAAEADAAIESVLAAVEGREDEGPVHRRLIRATLPRPEGQAPERREPDFTIRQQGGRGGREIDGNRAGGGFGQGRRQGRPQGQQPQRFGSSGRGPRQGDGSGQGRGNQEGRPAGSGGNRPGGGSGRRRRRGR